MNGSNINAAIVNRNNVKEIELIIPDKRSEAIKDPATMMVARITKKWD